MEGELIEKILNISFEIVPLKYPLLFLYYRPLTAETKKILGLQGEDGECQDDDGVQKPFSASNPNPRKFKSMARARDDRHDDDIHDSSNDAVNARTENGGNRSKNNDSNKDNKVASREDLGFVIDGS